MLAKQKNLEQVERTRKKTAERVRQMIKPGRPALPKRGQKQAIEKVDQDLFTTHQLPYAERFVIPLLDWRETDFYKKLVLKKDETWPEDLMPSYETDNFVRLIRMYRMKRGAQCDELVG